MHNNKKDDISEYVEKTKAQITIVDHIINIGCGLSVAVTILCIIVVLINLF